MADPDFPCALSLSIPFPTNRLAQTALTAISVDKELSPLVRRSFSLDAPRAGAPDADASVLRVDYRATTNRMLRVATNSFMESLGLVIEVMQKMDVGVIEASLKEVEAA